MPVTDTGDETMQDNTQTGPSMSMGGLEGIIPNVLTREEKIAIFHKKKLHWEAEEWEKGRLKLLQRSNPSTSVGSPVPSAAPSQGLRKGTAASHEAENLPKRQPIGPVPSNPGAEEPVTVASANASEGTLSASAIMIEEDPFLSPRSSFEWSDIRTPKKPLLCIIQVSNSTRIRSFAKDTKKWAFRLTFDTNREQVPTLTMKLFSNGIQGRQDRMVSRRVIKEDWMFTNSKIHRMADCAKNGRIRNRRILGTDQGKARLICIGEIPTENRRPLLARTPVREEAEDAENNFETSDTRIIGLKSAADRILPTIRTLSQTEMEHDQQFQDINEPTQSTSGTVEGDHVTKTDKSSADQEMGDSASSPTKKRGSNKGF